MPSSLNEWDPQREAFENKNFNPDLGSRKKNVASNAAFSLFVKGIPLELTQIGFKNLFATYGNVLSAKILPQKQSEFDAAVGFINYGSLSEAKNAIRNLNGFKLGKLTLRVNHAYDKKKPENTFSELLQKLEKGPLIDTDLKDLMQKTVEDFSLYNTRASHSSNMSTFGLQKEPGTSLKSPPKPQRLLMDEASKNQLFEKSYNPIQERYPDNESEVKTVNQSSHDVNRKSTSSVEKSVERSLPPVDEKLASLKKNQGTDEKGQMYIDKSCVKVKALSKTTNPNGNKDSSCQVCHKKTNMLCGACSLSRYCSQACQAADWQDHKLICKQSKDVSVSNASDNTACNRTFFNKNISHQQQPDVHTVVESSQKCVKLTKIKSSIELFSSNITAGNLIDVEVLSILSDCAMIICQNQDHTYQSKLKDLQISLNKYFRSQKPSLLTSPAVGDVCATVFSEDKQWYRAVVKKLLPKSTVLVYYVDYGNTEIIKSNMLMHLDSSFCQHPAFSMKCKLAGSKKIATWSDEQLKFLHSTLQKSNAMLNAKVVEIVGECIFAEFSVGNMSLNETICKKGVLKSAEKVSSSQVNNSKQGQSETASTDLSSSLSESALLSSKVSTLNVGESFLNCDEHVGSKDSKVTQTESGSESPSFSPNFPEGQFPVFISFVENPTCFYCQVVNDDLLLLHQSLENLAEYGFTEEVEFVPKVGKFCSAIYADDGKWCRGKVLRAVTPELYLIQYIDFGNIAEVSIKNIKLLPKEFTLPVLTLHASLSDCFPISHQGWSSAAISMMKRFENASCMAEVTRRGKDKVELTLCTGDESISVNEQLVSSGFGITKPKECDSSTASENNSHAVDMVRECEKQCPVLEPAMDEIVPIHVTSVDQQGMFYCQLIHEGLVDLEILNEKLNLHCATCQSKVLEKPLPGMCCAAYYAKGKTWNRAIVLPMVDCKEIETDSVLVRFLDFGNSEVVNVDGVKLLPDEYKELPEQALLCTLGDVKPFPGPEWSEEMKIEMNGYIEVSDIIIEAKFISKNEGQYVIKSPAIVNNLIKKQIAEYAF